MIKFLRFNTVLMVVFYIFVFTNTISASQNFIEEYTQHLVQIENQMKDTFSFEDSQYLYGLEKICLNAQKEKTVFGVLFLFENYLDSNFKNNTLTREEALNIIVAMNAWAYACEAFILSASDDRESPNDLIGLSYYIETSLNRENTAFKKFKKWRSRIIDTDFRAQEKAYDTEFSGKAFAKDIVKGLFILPLLDPDVWRDGPSAKAAKEALKEYDGELPNTLPLEWYNISIEFVEIGKGFNRMITRLNKLIDYYSKNYSANRHALELLVKYKQISYQYYKDMDTLARYYIFDSPVSCYADYRLYQFKAAHAFFDDDYAMETAVIEFSKIDQFNYIITNYTIKKLTDITGIFKGKLGSKYEDLKTRSKLAPDWYNLLKQIEPPESKKKKQP